MSQNVKLLISGIIQYLQCYFTISFWNIVYLVKYCLELPLWDMSYMLNL